MADGALNRTLTLTLDEATADRLDQAAREAGLATETYVGDLIADSLMDSSDADRRTDEVRRRQWELSEVALAEYDRTGISFPLEEVLRDIRSDLETRLASEA